MKSRILLWAACLLALSPMAPNALGGDTDPPQAPNAVYTVAYKDRIEVWWYGVPNTIAYRVYRGKSASVSSAALVATIPETGDPTISWDDRTAGVLSVPYFTTFYYWIEAVNSYGSARNSSVFATGFRSPGAPHGTPGLSVHPGSSTAGVELSWNSCEYATFYDIYRGTSSWGPSDGPASPLVTLSSSSLSYTDTDATPGVDYWYQVVARNPTGVQQGDLKSSYRTVFLSIPSDPITLPVSGGSRTFTIQANTSWTVSDYDWLTISTPFGSGNGTCSYSFTANISATSRSVPITVRAGAGTSHPKTHIITVVQEGNSALGKAVDWEERSFITGGNTGWKRVTSPSLDGEDAAQSGAIGGSQSSWMQTTVLGPTLVSFWWNVSSEAGGDTLSFSVDGTQREAISGTDGVWRRRKVILSTGSHTLRWTYAKNSSVNKGSDAGWVDGFEILSYPIRRGYHDGSDDSDIPVGSPSDPLDHNYYFIPNGRSGRYWENRADGTWICHVEGSDEDPGALQQAIDEAEDGDTILVWPGCYDPITVYKDLAIVAAGSRNETFINAKYADNCVSFDEGSDRAFLSGFTLVQGWSSSFGGGVCGGTLRNCVIANCSSGFDGGGASCANLTDCVLLGNTAKRNGGAAESCVLNRCELRDNTAGGYGGAIENSTATGCLLAGNYADRAGGADNSTLMSCTVADNTATTSHGGVWRCTVRNSIVASNTAPGAANWGTADAKTTFAYSCASPVPPGTGNFNAAPGFVDFAKGNFHLSNVSKCRDKGNRNLTKAPYDLAGLDRVMGSNIDVGCYEYATGVTPLDPADYDGDGVPDIGFYNPKTTTWFLKRTSDTFVRREKLGFSGGTIIPRDYDGDGIRDPAIYNPNSGTWQILQSTTGEVAEKKLGWKGIDLVDAADFDGDGCADPIIFNPASKTWQVLRSGDGGTTVVKDFGWAGIKPVCGDYDGDGLAELAFYSPTSCIWYIRWRDGTQTSLKLGVSGARIFPLDADFDGTLDPCYFNPSTGKWTWKSLVNGRGETVKFGDKTVTPHPFDWDGDGVPDTMGFYSPYRAGFLDNFLGAMGGRQVFMVNF